LHFCVEELVFASMAIIQDLLPRHAYLLYRYLLKDGVLDGHRQHLKHDIENIIVPVHVDEDPLIQEINISNHGHPFPKDSKFYHYVWNGKIDEGHRVMIFKGYVDNPITQ